MSDNARPEPYEDDDLPDGTYLEFSHGAAGSDEEEPDALTGDAHKRD